MATRGQSDPRGALEHATVRCAVDDDGLLVGGVAGTRYMFSFSRSHVCSRMHLLALRLVCGFRLCPVGGT
jgi:hypothetical protein